MYQEYGNPLKRLHTRSDSRFMRFSGDEHFFYLIDRGLMSNRLQRSFEKSG